MKQQVFTTPVTAVDWLKQLVVDWCPSLNFGWLVPQFRSVTVDVETQQVHTYYNVVPVSISRDRERLYFAKFNELPIRIRHETWLEMDPCTSEDIANAMAEEWHLLRSDQAAWYMKRK
jgi:hypothetical protein